MKALLVKMSSLGDVVHTLPAVTDAARAGVRFDWVVEEAFQAVPAAHPAVARVIPIAWRRWRGDIRHSGREVRSFFRALASEQYDLAIDSQGLLKSALVMSRVRAGEKAGFSQMSAREPVASLFYGRTLDVPRNLHAIERQRKLFAAALDYSHDAFTASFGLHTNPTRKSNRRHAGKGLEIAEPSALDLEGTILASKTVDENCGHGDLSDTSSKSGAPEIDAEGSASANNSGQETGTDSTQEVGTRPHSVRRCVFLHGASWATKLWPEPMWVELARLAKGANWQPVLPWGNNEERARAQRIANASDATVLPAMNLSDLMAALRCAGLAIGVDSGLAHLAAALGIPTIVLYGPTASVLTGCKGANTQNLQADFACSPCLSKSCRYSGAPVSWREIAITPPCYGALKPATVWAAALARIPHQGPR